MFSSITELRKLLKYDEPDIPVNYYPDDNPHNKPVKSWRCHANTLYTNWLNYYVYQSTPYDWNTRTIEGEQE